VKCIFRVWWRNQNHYPTDPTYRFCRTLFVHWYTNTKTVRDLSYPHLYLETKNKREPLHTNWTSQTVTKTLLGGDTQCCGRTESHIGATKDTVIWQDGELYVYGSHREPRHSSKIVCYFGATEDTDLWQGGTFRSPWRHNVGKWCATSDPLKYPFPGWRACWEPT
jgi:hypothetical protein